MVDDLQSLMAKRTAVVDPPAPVEGQTEKEKVVVKTTKEAPPAPEEKVVVKTTEEKKAEEAPRAAKPVEVKTKEVHSISDEDIFKVLNEKAGISLTSWEDLKKTREPQFANEFIRQANEFSQATNRDVKDFIRLQEMDTDNMSEQDKVKFQLQSENPMLTPSQVELMFKRRYAKKEINDNMDDDEKRLALEDNQFVDIQMRTDAYKAEQAIKQLKEAYMKPIEPKYSEPRPTVDSEKFNQTWNSVAENIESLTFNVSNEKSMDWQLDENEKKFFKNPVHPDKFLDRYKKSDGSYDVSKYAVELYILDNFDKILRGAAASRAGEGVESIIDEAKGVLAKDQRDTGGAKQMTGKDAAKAMFLGR
jgi:hypothetical protein